MGYRSDGLWIIAGEPEVVTAAWTAARLELPAPAEYDECTWGDFKTFRKNGIGYIRFQFSGWKWYESYASVQWYEAVWAYLDRYSEEHAPGLCGKRIRIGEDDNDNDEREFGDSSLHIAMYIERHIRDDEEVDGEPLISTDKGETA